MLSSHVEYINEEENYEIKNKFNKFTSNPKETSKMNNINFINKVNPLVTNHENVVNLSEETFIKEELNLLSKRLKPCVGFSRNIEKCTV